MFQLGTINQAVILCAGKGERMGEKFKDTQKCTLIINEKPLIFQNVINLVETGIKEIILLTGYKSEQVEACFEKTPYQKYIKYVFCGNPYDVPLNTISTLRQAKNLIGEPFLCVHGDILFRPTTIITELYNTFAKYQPRLIISVSKRKHIASTHARVIYNDALTVLDVKYYNNSDADVWIGIDLCQPYLLDRYCGDENTSQLHLAKAILNNGEMIKAEIYQYPWIHIVTPDDILPCVPL